MVWVRKRNRRRHKHSIICNSSSDGTIFNYCLQTHGRHEQIGLVQFSVIIYARDTLSFLGIFTYWVDIFIRVQQLLVHCQCTTRQEKVGCFLKDKGGSSRPGKVGATITGFSPVAFTKFIAGMIGKKGFNPFISQIGWAIFGLPRGTNGWIGQFKSWFSTGSILSVSSLQITNNVPFVGTIVGKMNRLP